MRARTWLVGGVVALLLFGALVWHGYSEATRDPVMRSAHIVMPQLPSGTAPIRLALLSDIHIGNAATSPERLDRVVALINAARPDIVVIAGDSVNGDYRGDPKTKPELLTAPLSRLRAPLGIFATMGNHDNETEPKRVRKALAHAGITVLANSAARAGPLAIAAIDDSSSGMSLVDKTMTSARAVGGVPIYATHSPTIEKWLRGKPITLLLLGHTHCGQVVLGMGDWTFYPTEWLFSRPYSKALRCGIGQVDGRLSVVTAGIGTTSAPLRYGAPPDWWLLTLAPAATGKPAP